MFIPVGLIAGLARMALDDHANQTAAQFASFEASYEFEQEMHKQRLVAHQLWEASTGASGALLVLVANDWSNTEIDGVRMSVRAAGAVSGTPGYRESSDPLGDSPFGLCGVCPGRHKIRTTLAGRPIDVDLTIHPAEAVFRQLDRTTRTWTSYDAPTQAQLLERAMARRDGFLHYFEHVAQPRIKAMVSKGTDEALRESFALIKAALSAISNGDEAGAMGHVKTASKTLNGAAVPSFAPLTNVIGFHAFDRLGKNDPKGAWLTLQAGLAILPDDPTLLAALGEIQIRSGGAALGKANLKRALERREGLAPALATRVDELLAAGGGL